jgi:hypothetical protein
MIPQFYPHHTCAAGLQLAKHELAVALFDPAHHKAIRPSFTAPLRTMSSLREFHYIFSCRSCGDNVAFLDGGVNVTVPDNPTLAHSMNKPSHGFICKNQCFGCFSIVFVAFPIMSTGLIQG